MSTELKIYEENYGDYYLVKLQGEADISSSQELKETLYNIIEKNSLDIRLECNELTYIDSTGLGILAGALKKIKQQGNNIIIVGLKDNIKKLFFITGLDKIFIVE